MNFEIKSKDDKGNVTFEGTANAVQASFLFEVGINYLLQRGVQPLLTPDDEEPIVAEGTDTVQ